MNIALAMRWELSITIAIPVTPPLTITACTAPGRRTGCRTTITTNKMAFVTMTIATTLIIHIDPIILRIKSIQVI
jgi:hypothetical protein